MGYPTDEEITGRAGARPLVLKLSLNELAQQACRIAEEHGFTESTPAEQIALMHSELSEALEDIRDGREFTKLTFKFASQLGAEANVHEIDGELGKPVGVPSEMADVVIRVLHFCGRYGIDLDDAVAKKMAYNASRPFKHGKKF